MNTLCIPLTILAGMSTAAGYIYLAIGDHPRAIAAFTASGIAALLGLQLLNK